MVKEATTIPPNTLVTADNWEELQGKGLRFCVNVFDYTGYNFGFTGDESARVQQMLAWEVGEDRVFEGWVCIEGKVTEPDEP
ncbi:MAG TPA: hypothetical protein VMR98_03250, partial [Candidatus Polarisedimenticolaceae bacterium]|nr:hypothetical protein [Candidatus Polarisedimenticolaceae bacterium]